MQDSIPSRIKLSIIDLCIFRNETAHIDFLYCTYLVFKEIKQFNYFKL